MRKYLGLFKETAREFNEDKAPRLGAALAYYTIFSIAPLILIAIAIAGMVFGEEAARNEIQRQLQNVIGGNAAKALQDMVKSAARPKTGTVATILGIVTLLFGASGVFGQLKDALNTMWEVEPPKTGGIFGLLKNRFLSVAMVLVVAFLLLVSLVIDAVISAGANRIFGESTAIIAHTIELTISFAVVTVLFALIFRYLPDVRIEWRDVWLGAVFTSILFIIGKFALGLYLGRSAVGSAYGAAGSLVVLLLWIYYSAQIMLFGAEFTQVYSRSHGSRAGEAKPAPFHQIEPSRAHAPSLTPQRATARKSGGGLKFAIGGVTGLFIGVLAGAIGGAIVLVKSVMKLIVAPFR